MMYRRHVEISIMTVVVFVVGLVASVIIAPHISDASDISVHVGSSGKCPWVTQSQHHSASPLRLANEVLAQMTLTQKAYFVVLTSHRALQNENVGIPSLCIPAMSMSDGPSGLGSGLRGVTQFPSALSVAATFNTAIAQSVGAAVAAEARTKGIVALQGTEMNLARIPQSGRIFETYGEDPYLTSALGVANIRGIQSQGVMDVAKHFGAYTQETARVRLNQIVSSRALAELYDVPFRAAVQQAHVASVMCSYGRINSVNTCSDPMIYSKLKQWGFTGFVRSDLQAVHNIALALRAGISLIKPASSATIERLVTSGIVPMTDLDRAVRSVLTDMFKFGVIARPRVLSLYALASTAGHVRVALQTAQSSIVLLKNAGSVLPISKSVTSVAVIGDMAAAAQLVSGGGSSAVVAPYVITPLAALRSTLGRHVHVTYKIGSPPGLELSALNDVSIVDGYPLKTITRLLSPVDTDAADLYILESPNVTPALATATTPGVGQGWVKWQMDLRAQKTGTYEVAFQQTGDTWIYLNHRLILSSPGLHIRSDLATTVALVAGRRYTFSATWFAIRGHRAPQFGIQDVTPQIQAAVSAARKSQVAIVFAGDYNQEGTDRANLYLPGVANALISAVAAVNPRTIVVLNTGGAVYMPWRSHVAAVLEAWYPGQEDGAAIAAVLSGRVNPSGHLPITFPASPPGLPVTATSEYPGINSVVDFGTGLNIGYRWYQANNVTPLFPFGFGLSYTKFALSNLVVDKSTSSVNVYVTVMNVGAKLGADVVQTYVRYPSSAGEPPEQLRAFTRVTLAPAEARRIRMTIPMSGFQIFSGQTFSIVPGLYGIDVGQSSADLQLHANVELS
jgi:beta-glucosidase